MFIKKDLRKIDEILADPNDTRERMLLPKRSSEFRGSVKILCKEGNVKKLSNLKVLNLYENDLTSLKGIGLLAGTTVEDINLGYNKLAHIPMEFGSLSTIRTLWLDDNHLDTFPICLCSITGLQVLRLTGNNLTTIPPSISSLSNLVTLAVDNNNITEFPLGCLSLPKLEHLWLRQNKLRSLPDRVDELVS
jgi:Leucine-rich repeat (LRR) protein